MRHGRAVLAPARWLLTADDLPVPGCAMPAWEQAISAWRARWHVPSGVVLREGDRRLPALVPGYSALLHAHLFGHPLRFDEILTDHLPRLLDNVEDHVVLWWFRRHHDTTRPDTDHHLGLCRRFPPTPSWTDSRQPV